MKKIKQGIGKIMAVLLIGAMFGTSVPLGVPTVDAAVADWIQGASIHPYTTTHFGTDDMKASLRQLAGTGANYAVLIIPYYQANRGSSEMRPGWNTPTDESLISAIQYAKSLGMNVMLKPHLETDYIEWRGNIDAFDREAWFASYTAMLQHYGRIAEEQGVEDYCIGTELIRMANPNYNSTNTENWKEMIADVREVYSGKLTYSSNWDGELEFLGFWEDLDYIGISAYYDLYHANNSSPEELKKSWEGWKNGVVEPIYERYGKPVMFTELGYRSIEGAHRNPWDWERWAPYNETDQANAYEALFSYWNDYPWMIGVALWRWDVNPNAGGQGDTDYMPQNKSAQQVMTRWFGGDGSLPPEPTEPATTTPTTPATTTPSNPATTTPSNPDPDTSNPGNSGDPDFNVVGRSMSITNRIGNKGEYRIDIENEGTNTTGAVVDVEVYREDGSRLLQRIFDNQTFGDNQTKSFNVEIVPDSNGTHKLAVGIFNRDWSTNYYWNADLIDINVGTRGGTPPSSNPDPNTDTDTDTDTDPDTATTTPDNPATTTPATTTPATGGDVTVTPTEGATTTPAEPIDDPRVIWPPQPENEPLDIWWPVNGADVSKVQPFKARLGDADLDSYDIFWQIDGGELSKLGNSLVDAPHKESSIDLSTWNSKGDSGTYTVNFIGKFPNGETIKEQSVDINIHHY